MADRERERLENLSGQADALVFFLRDDPRIVRAHRLFHRAYDRAERRMQNLRNLDALIELDAETADDIMREATRAS